MLFSMKDYFLIMSRIGLLRNNRAWAWPGFEELSAENLVQRGVGEYHRNDCPTKGTWTYQVFRHREPNSETKVFCRRGCALVVFR